MATIILKATDRKLECSISVCNQINELKSKNADPKTPLEIDGIFLELGDVRYAIPDMEKDKELAKERSQKEYGDIISEYNQQFHEEIRRYTLGSIENKIHFNMEVAKMYAFAITGSKNIDDISDTLISIFREELTKTRLVVNPTKYLKLFRVSDVKSDDSLKSTEYLVRSAPFRIMDNYLSNVMSEVRKI